MTVDIAVYRYLGDKEGRVIVDGLIGADSIAIARGKVELNKEAQSMQGVNTEVVYRDGVRVGQLRKVFTSFGEIKYDKIVGVSHRFSGGQLTTSLRCTRLLD
jgi:hypothetical protein